MIISKYTRILSCNDGELIYNTKNGAQLFVKNDDELMNDVNFLKKGKLDDLKSEIIKNIFCVDEDTNELLTIVSNYYKNYFDPTYLSFIIMPNNTCNFLCKYCYQEHDKKLMDDSIVNDFISAIKKYHADIGIKKFYIEWFGGEPMMSYGIVKKITSSLSDFFEKNDIDYHFGMTTNGSLLSKNVVDFLFEHKFDFFQITIDGDKKNHNYYRPFINGDGSYDKIFENLKYMHSKQNVFDVAIRVNYNLETSNHLTELLEDIKNNLDNRFSIFYHPIGKWGGKNDATLDVVTGSMSNVALCEFSNEAVKRGIYPKLNIMHMNPFGLMCYASMPYFFTLGTDGMLRKCNEEDPNLDSFNIVGTIKGGELKFNINKWSRFILPGGDISIPKKCQECLYFPLCLGLNCPRDFFNGYHECPNSIDAFEDMLLVKLKAMSTRKD